MANSANVTLVATSLKGIDAKRSNTKTKAKLF